MSEADNAAENGPGPGDRRESPLSHPGLLHEVVLGPGSRGVARPTIVLLPMDAQTSHDICLGLNRFNA